MSWNPRSLFPRSVGVLIAGGLLLASVSPSLAQSSEDLESIRDKRAAAQAEAARQAATVDSASAEVDDLTEALNAVQANVSAQETRVSDAERSLADAEARLESASTAVTEKETEITALREQLAARAISSFISQGDADAVFLESETMNQAVRMQTVVADITQGEADVEEQLRAAEEDLEIERALAADATAEAEILRNDLTDQLVELESARDEQAALTAAAEERLDTELSELASIQQLDADLAASEQAEVDRLAAELARRRAAEAEQPASNGSSGTTAPSAPSSGSSGAPVGSGEIVSVQGIQVHSSIASNFEAMLNAAAADGINLSGGGYRNPAGQIAVRKNNCGTSNYAVYQMPASSCSPPTARPGTSMHEQGKAIDFTYGGSIIGSRSSPAYQWLAANAASYGFYNLPSEPWHWSVNGR